MSEHLTAFYCVKQREATLQMPIKREAPKIYERFSCLLLQSSLYAGQSTFALQATNDNPNSNKAVHKMILFINYSWMKENFTINDNVGGYEISIKKVSKPNVVIWFCVCLWIRIFRIKCQQKQYSPA